MGRVVSMSNHFGRIRIAVVGQTPPPVHGQALLIRQMLDTDLAPIEWVQVPMRFSLRDGEVGQAQIRKALRLPAVIIRTLLARFRGRAKVLYYPPAGPDLVPILRDILLLGSTRWAFEAVVFHFHAGGLAEELDQLPGPVARLARWVYEGADLAIVQSEQGITDGVKLKARMVEVVPCGVPDVAHNYQRSRPRGATPRILQIGTLSEEKGVLALLDACDQLAEREVPFELTLAGPFEDAHTEREVRERLIRLGLEPAEVLTGVVEGDRKWQLFADADLLSFATHYRAETFGLVALEAMQFGLPVVGTRWRALPEIVVDGETGLLVEVGDTAGLTDALGELLRDPGLRDAMGASGRARFEENYGADSWAGRMREALLGGASNRAT
jgi:glycosyltransferase involved in cell wall biosynthesis